MLTKEENDALTSIRPGAPVGDLMRRYWHPFAAVAEFDQHPTKPVRLFGEDLVAYKDKSGSFGLMQRHCPHRGADFIYGIPEQCGLRCHYHGWQFDQQGACVAQPLEEPGFKDKVKVTAYPVQAKGGMLWGYFGPSPAPLLPDYIGFSRAGFKFLSFIELPCNWVQIQEGLYDTLHVEWLHDKWSFVLKGLDVPKDRPHHVGHRWIEFEQGFMFQRKFEAWPERMGTGHTVLFPNGDAGAGGGGFYGYQVPIDDTHTLCVNYNNLYFWRGEPLPPDAPVDQKTIPYYRAQLEVDPKTGWVQHCDTHLLNQDYAAAVGQGPIADRTKERLGSFDDGVIMFRKKLFEQAKLVAEGGDPKGTVRDAAKNHRVELPGGRGLYGTKVDANNNPNEGLLALRALEPENVFFILNILSPHRVPNQITSELIRVLEKTRAALGK